MDGIAAGLAGIAATVVMTIGLYAAPLFKLPHMDILRTLGRTVTDRDRFALPVGSVAHLFIGGLFALVYASLWRLGVGKVRWTWGTIFGAVHGVIAVIMMTPVLIIHPHRPHFPTRRRMGLYFLAHLIYGTLVAVFYGALRRGSATLPAVDDRLPYAGLPGEE